MYYLQSRYYDPEIGRFINADAYAATGQSFVGNNMFVYCLNNPIVYVDSTGCFPWFVVAVLAVCAIAGAIYGATTNDNLAEKMAPQADNNHITTPLIVPPPSQSNNMPAYEVPSLPIPSETTLPAKTNNTKDDITSDTTMGRKTNNALTTQERINNVIIGTSVGLMVGGSVVFLAGAGACVAGYTSVIAPILGMAGKQAVAWGLLSYNVFPVFVAPFLGLEMEVLEYPS